MKEDIKYLATMTIPTDCFCKIIIFLEQHELKILVKAFYINKEYRQIICEVLKYVKHSRLHVSRWSHQFKMTNKNELSNIQNLKYVSDKCQDLIVSNNYKSYFQSIKIINNNLRKLHIDIHNSRIHNFIIIAKNLKILYLLNCVNLNEGIIKNIIENCPNLERLFISYCGKIKKNYLKTLKEIKPLLKLTYVERV